MGQASGPTTSSGGDGRASLLDLHHLAEGPLPSHLQHEVLKLPDAPPTVPDDGRRSTALHHSPWRLDDFSGPKRRVPEHQDPSQPIQVPTLPVRRIDMADHYASLWKRPGPVRVYQIHQTTPKEVEREAGHQMPGVAGRHHRPPPVPPPPGLGGTGDAERPVVRGPQGEPQGRQVDPDARPCLPWR